MVCLSTDTAFKFNKSIKPTSLQGKDWGGGCCTTKISVSKFDKASSSWVDVGIPGIGNARYQPSLAFSPGGNPIVAFTESTPSMGVRVFKYDGVNWNPIMLPVPVTGFPFLATDKTGTLYLAGVTSESTYTVWKYNGSEWLSLGSVGSYVTGLKIASDGTPNVLLGVGQISVVRYLPGPQTTLVVSANPTELVVSETSTLSYSGGSGTGATSYNVTGPCTLAENKVTANAVGTCFVTATKEGDSDYLAATSTPVPITIILERKRTLAVSKTGSGTITSVPANISCGSTCSVQFQLGSTVSLIAQPDYGFAFVGWGGGCSSNGTCIIIMDGDKSVSANFIELPKYPVTVAKASTGVVSSEPAGILCGGPYRQCNSSFSSAKLTANPNPGYEFTKWAGCQAPEGNICYIKPTSKMSIKAVFQKLPKYNLKIAKNTLGSVTSSPAGLNCTGKKKSCSVKFNKGTGVTLTAVPKGGRSFIGWRGACTGINECLLLMDGNKGVVATFQ